MRAAEAGNRNGGTGTHTDVLKPKTRVRSEIVIPPMEIRVAEVPIIGVQSLVEHKFSKKATRQIEEKQQGKAKQKLPPKDPIEEFLGSLHTMPGTPEPKAQTLKDGTVVAKGKFGFPASGVKKAIVRAATYAELEMTFVRGALHVLGDMIEIIGPLPVMRTDNVRLNGKTADIRYRGEFREWRAVLRIRYNARALTLEQIVNLINIAGFAVGLGEGRPEKTSGLAWGTFQVSSDALKDMADGVKH